jgi:membrane associated rhomboid family serine protease
MPDAIPTLEDILRLCAAAAPEPWYPSVYVRTCGIPRDLLDKPLEDLRLGGLIQLTPWVEGKNQGYRLTPEGEQALNDGHILSQLRAGMVPRSPRVERPVRDDAEADDEPAAILGGALTPSRPIVTQVLIWSNVLVFAYGLWLAVQANIPSSAYLEGNPRDPAMRRGLNEIHMETGAIWGEAIVAGQWWRLMSNAFVHLGLLHLFMNMLSLYWIGPAVEQMWGGWRYLLLYLTSALGGSCAMVLATPDALGAGASGAIWGVMTSMGAWILLNRRSLRADVASIVLRRLLTVLVLNVLISLSPGISAAAHFGGGAVGVIVSLPLNWTRRARGVWRGLAVLAVLAVPVLCLVVFTWYQTVDPWWVKHYQLERLRRELRALEETRSKQPADPARAKVDSRAFHERYAPAIDHATRAARVVFETKARPLLDQPPDKRPAAEVAETRAALQAAQAELARVLKELPAPDAVADERMARTLQIGRHYVDAAAERLGVAIELLSARASNRDLKERLYQLGRQTGDYHQRWQTALRQGATTN